MIGAAFLVFTSMAFVAVICYLVISKYAKPAELPKVPECLEYDESRMDYFPAIPAQTVEKRKRLSRRERARRRNRL